jgi:NAD(P)-dependent dehydrogenase (short-subunit alcohol dehydrogenase family)
MKHDSPVPDTTIPGRKSVIVTGGASGIGLAMVRHFASQGHMVAVLDISDDTGVKTIERLADEYPSAQLSFKKCDTSSWLEQRKTFEQVFNEHSGKLDVAMVNAGISEPNPWNLCDLTENEPSEPALEVLNINLLGAMYSKSFLLHVNHAILSPAR